MKNLILFVLCAIFLTSCAKFPDGSSVWQDWLWVIPTLTGIGSLWFLYRSLLKSKSGSEQQKPGGWWDLKANIPFYKQNVFKFAAVLFVATIGIIIWVNSDK